MKRILTKLRTLLTGSGSAGESTARALDYDQMILLDAEYLAETGIRNAYEEIKLALKNYLATPEEITENIDNDKPSYSVTAGGRTYDVYGPGLPEGDGQVWGLATVALFNIVNNQLEDCDVKFYAIDGGNDLGGMFLTQEEYDTAKVSLERKADWPYLPVMEHPWYGQRHEEA